MIYFLVFLLFLVGLQIDHLVNLFGAVSQEALEVTNESVDVALASGLQNDVLVVVIPKIQQQLSTEDH